jgi:hypothetical protein
MTKQVRAREWARKEVEFWTDSSGHLTQTPQEMAERGWRAGYEAGRREAAAARRQAAQALQALARLAEIADTDPFASIGHVLEHVMPEVRAVATQGDARAAQA